MKRSFYLALIFAGFSFFMTASAEQVKNAGMPSEDISEVLAGGNAIVTLPIPGTLCQSSTVVVNFTASGLYTLGNQFTAELSDGSGSFAAPIAIGSIFLAGDIPENPNPFIYAIIPAVPFGTGYRIRVVSSLPAVTGSDNGTNIIIKEEVAPSIPTVAVNGPTEFCFGSATTFLVSSALTGNLWFPGGVNTNVFLGVVSSGAYFTQVTAANGCATSSVPVIITVDPPITAILFYFENDIQASTSLDTTITICEGDSAQLGVSIQGGTAPFDIIYTSDGLNNIILENVGTLLPNGSYAATFFVTDPGTYQLVNLVDNFPTNCSAGSIGGLVNVQTTPRPETAFSYNPFCGSTSQPPVPSAGFLAGGSYTFNPNPGDGAVVDSVTGVISGANIGNTYTVSYTAEGPFCDATSTTTITVDSSDVVEFDIVSFCPNHSSAFPITAPGFAIGGTFAFAVTPSDGAIINASTGVISNASPLTTYIISYTSPEETLCTNTFLDTVSTFTVPSITGTVENSLCGQNIGSIDITVSGGILPYTFSWSNGSTTADIDSLLAGAYTITVADSQGCASDTTFTIINDNQPTLTFDVNNATCGDTTSGAINLTVTDGVGPFSFVWAPGNQTTEDLSGLIAGTYTVEVTDSGTTCVVSGSATIINQDAPVATFVSTNSLCGQSVGSIDVTITGGTGTVNHSWSNGATTEDLFNLTDGTYTDTITDDNCQVIITATLTNDDQFITSFTTTNPTCDNASGGAIDLTITGGIAPFTFAWSPNIENVSEDLTGLTAGTYQVIVSSISTCSDTLSITIAPANNISLSAEEDSSTCGNQDGSIDLTVNGGSGNYSYLWSTNEITEDISGLAAGSYSVSVIDLADSSCTASLLVTIVNGNVPSLDFAVTPSSCLINTGAIDLTVNGGSGNFEFAWTGPDAFVASSEDLAGLFIGEYNVTVTDITTTCVVSGSATVVDNAPAITSTVVNTTCGQSNGIIDITITGGTAPFVTLWDGIDSPVDQVNLASGTYIILVTDSNGCTATDTFNIAPSIQPTLSLDFTNPSCGNDTGSVSITFSDAVAPVFFNWQLDGTAFSTDEDLTGLAPGTYTVLATDLNGCSARDTAVLIYDNLPVLITAITNTICGLSTGTVELTITAGTEPFVISWTGPGDFEDSTLVIDSLSFGCYNVSVSDGAGCIVTAQACIENDSVPEITFNVEQPSCNLANGTITAIVSGGVLPYSFLWSGTADTDSILAGIGEGTYTLQVTDVNNCQISDSVAVVNTGVPSVFSSETDPSCGSADGSIDITVTGGVAPYTFEWTGTGVVPDSEDQTGLAAGNYSVTVTDSLGCEITGDFTLNNSNGPQISFTPENPTCNNNDGAIDLTVNGGSGEFSFLWTGPGVVTDAEDQDDLVAGVYTVVVTDDTTGCQDSLTITLINSNSFNASGIITDASCGLSNGEVNITIEGGTPEFTFSWCNGQDTEDVTGLPAGDCQVIINDAAGCNDTLSFTIGGGVAVNITANVTNTTCGLCNGTASVDIADGTAPFTILWSNGAGVDSLGELCAGALTITVTDSAGCTDSVNVDIAPSSVPVIDIAQVNTTCGDSTGTITASITGGIGSYTFVWSGAVIGGDTTAFVDSIPAGTYSLIVTDSAGCTATTSVTIINTDLPVLEFALTNAACGTATGAIDLTVTNTSGETYSWTGPDSFTAATQDISGLIAGTYVVTVTSGECVVTDSATIINTDAPTASISSSSDTLCSGTSATLTITLTGTAPFTFIYTDGNLPVTVTSFAGTSFTVSVNPSSTTTYTLVSLISDVNPACQGNFPLESATVVVNPTPETPVVTANGPLTFCVGGSVTLTSSVAIGNNWNIQGADSSNQTITVTESGNYFTTVTNASGCTASSAPVTVVVGTGPQIFAGNDTTVCAGQPVQLQATGGGPDYIWSPSIYLSGTIIANPIAIPFETTTYSVSSSNDCGTSSDSITITVLPVIDATLGPDQNICLGDTVILSVPQVTGGIYQWGPSSAIIGDATGSSVLVNTLASSQIFVQTQNTNGCIDTDTVQINITVPSDTISIIALDTTTFCEGGSVILQASTGNNVVWSNGIENFDQILVTESGFYSVRLLTAGCPALSDTIEVVVNPNPVAIITADPSTTLCSGSCASLSAFQATNVSWILPDGSTSTDAVLTACTEGTYILVVTEGECEGRDTVVITIIPPITEPVITPPGPITICANEFVTLTSSYSIGNQWTWNGTPIIGGTVNAYTTNLPGTYTVIVITPEGCTDTSDAVTVTVKPVSDIEITTSSSTTVCNGAPVNIELTASAGFVSYSWQPNGETTQIITATTATTYTVTGVNSDGCSSDTSVTITESEPFTVDLTSTVYFDDFNISVQGGSDGLIFLSTDGGSGNFTYLWSNGSTTQNQENLTAGTYLVTVSDGSCQVVDSITLKEPSAIRLPNGFTPNGDGFNDFYVIKGIQGYIGNNVKIFNRWGDIIYSKDTYTNDWSGVSNDGNVLPDGTYFIVVDLNKEGTDNIEGFIDLRRSN